MAEPYEEVWREVYCSADALGEPTDGNPDGLRVDCDKYLKQEADHE
jgi:hypothetical protein